MVILVVDDAELAGGDTMDRGLGMDGVGIGGSLFQRTREVFGGVTDFKCNVRAQPFLRPVGSKRPLVERDRLGDRDWLVSLSNHSNRKGGGEPVDVVDGE